MTLESSPPHQVGEERISMTANVTMVNIMPR